MSMSINALIKTSYVQDYLHALNITDAVVLERPASFIVRLPKEDERHVNRLLILLPRGYASNKINQTNCSADVERAKISFKGAVREGKNAFSKTKNSLLFVGYDREQQGGDLDRPYLEFDIEEKNPDFTTRVFSAGGPPEHVVKPDGMGFYHTLINTSDDWLVIGVHKILHPRRAPDLANIMQGEAKQYLPVMEDLQKRILKQGDTLFDRAENAGIIEAVVNMPPAISLAALGELLYIRDTGEHETCTAFALFLKVGRDAPEIALSYLEQAMKDEIIPQFFGNQLAQKIGKLNTSPMRKIA